MLTPSLVFFVALSHETVLLALIVDLFVKLYVSAAVDALDCLCIVGSVCANKSMLIHLLLGWIQIFKIKMVPDLELIARTCIFVFFNELLSSLLCFIFHV